MILLLLPFFLQGAVMFADEFYFHRKRGLPRWEKVGHPLDTFSVLICFLFIYLQTPSEKNLFFYIGLCSFSCLLITKDEWVHAEKCEASEQWLHALLFVLHPIAFLSAYLIWQNQLYPSFLLSQVIILFIFMIYQITYWSFNEKSKQ